MNKFKFPILVFILIMAAGIVAPRLQTADAAPLAQAPPPNDNFADALIVASTPFVNSVENGAATTEPGEAASMCEPGAVYNTVWYAFTPVEGGKLTGDFASSFNGILSVYTGSSLTDLSELTCVYSDVTFQVAVTPGTTYYIRLSSRFEGDTGFAYVSLYFTPPPVNDNFADALILDSFPYQEIVNTSIATSEPNEPYSCSDYGYGALRTVWYAYTPLEKGVLRGNASGYVLSFLAVYTGSAVDSLTPLTCTNWDGTFQLSVTPGTTYYLQLGNLVEWDYGVNSIYLEFTPAPPNDDFADATIVANMPFQDTVNNAAATAEVGEPTPLCATGPLTQSGMRTLPLRMAC